MDIARRKLLAGAAALGLSAPLRACGGRARPEIRPAPAPAPVAAEDALGQSDGIGLAARINAGEISALEAAEAAIARARSLQPQLNFLAAQTFEAARRRARYPGAGALAGVPTLVKDLAEERGVPCSYGSRAYAGFIPQSQDPYVDAIYATGLNSLGKSSVPEFGLNATTETLLLGPTRNPWSLGHSSGGSSGGAAAAVAAGVVPIAHATDGGGSIRIPAACCGLFGLKPSRGRTTAENSSLPLQLSVDGCLSRSVRDSAAWLGLTELRGGRFAPMGIVGGPSERRLRVLLQVRDLLGRAPDPEVAAATEAAARLLESLGHMVEEAPAPTGGEAFVAAFQLYWAAGAGQAVREARRNRPEAKPEDILEPFTLALAEQAARASEAALDAAVVELRKAGAAHLALFERADILITPVLASPPAQLGELAPARPFAELEKALLDYVAYTPVQNVAGNPAMSVPLGQSTRGLPIGVQFTAGPGEDALLLALAFELEQANPWIGRRPKIFAG